MAGHTSGSSRRKHAYQRQNTHVVGTVEEVGWVRYVRCGDKRYRITRHGHQGAMPGDTVRARLQRGPSHERRAAVESVVKRAHQTLVGVFEQAGPLGVIRPLAGAARYDFFLPPHDTSAARHKVGPHDVVEVQIVSYPRRHEAGVVRITRKICDAHDPNLGHVYIMARYGLSSAYPQSALDEAQALEGDNTYSECDELRNDYRESCVLAIDPADARDHDDAISVVRTARGGWLLGVHIADVSHYVRWEGAIDLEARRRGASAYLADRVIPMLPEVLANHLCSLKAGQDRLTLSVEIELDATAHVMSYSIHPGIVRVCANISYEEVDRILARGTGEHADHGAGEHADRGTGEYAACDTAEYGDVLREAHALAQARHALRMRRGAIEFSSEESRVAFDEQGELSAPVVRCQTPATRLVEEAMLLANECVAEWLSDRGIVTPYRVHEAPSEDYLAQTARLLSILGAIDEEECNALVQGDARVAMQIVQRTQGSTLELPVSSLLLRCMARAEYRPQNLGHFALAASAYCHFTSPIRRYPDVLVHRAVKLVLMDEHHNVLPREARDWLVAGGLPELGRQMGTLCRSCNERERAADAASTQSQKVMAARYFEPYVGTVFEGNVSWIDESGASIRLDNGGVVGKILAVSSTSKPWAFDARRFALINAEHTQELMLGMRVRVEVICVDTVRGWIDLGLKEVLAALH